MKNKNLILIGTLLIILCNSCGNSSLQKEYDDLLISYKEKSEKLELCEKENEDLKNTPDLRLAKAKTLQSEGKYQDAKSELTELMNVFPGTAEAETAKIMFDQITKDEEKLKAEEERLKNMTFSEIKSSMKINYDQLTLNFVSVATNSTWTFDNYGSSYRYYSAERGFIYLVAKVNITSKENYPDLPPIIAYQLVSGKLEKIGTLSYKFARWKDYGSYLGNYADYGNDFAQTPTVYFSCGLNLSEDVAYKKPIFVVVQNKGCFTRKTEDFETPSVKYVEGSCTSKSTLSIEDFKSDYQLVTIINKSKI